MFIIRQPRFAKPNLPLAVVLLAAAGCATAQGRHGGPALDRRHLEASWNRALRGGSKALQQDLDTLGKLMDGLTAQVRKRWGQKETRVADRTVYVKYTESYQTRAIVDFDRGTIVVETMDDRDPRASLRRALVTTLLTDGDPRSVDLFSADAVAVRRGGEPYLAGLVQDDAGQPVRTAEQAERFAARLVERHLATHPVEVEGGRKTASFVKIAMVANFHNRTAEKYRPAVLRFAQQHRLSPSLVLAVIRTESNFNPFAVSPVPAFGLMQLVPRTGGRDAYRRSTGVDEAPSQQYLFDPDHNIELGTTYLEILASGPLAAVRDPVAREYCVIAAYNTGAGNVLKTFGRDRGEAVAAINALGPEAVYDRLRSSLPYAETRQYVARVVGYRKQFTSRAPEPPAALASDATTRPGL